MNLYLQLLNRTDLAQIYGWAETIRAERFMSHCVPDFRRILLWETIVVDVVDIGTLWSESKPDEPEVSVLGILIGAPYMSPCNCLLPKVRLSTDVGRRENERNGRANSFRL